MIELSSPLQTLVAETCCDRKVGTVYGFPPGSWVDHEPRAAAIESAQFTAGDQVGAL